MYILPSQADMSFETLIPRILAWNLALRTFLSLIQMKNCLLNNFQQKVWFSLEKKNVIFKNSEKSKWELIHSYNL